MITVEMTFAKTDFFPLWSEGCEKEQRSMFVSRWRKRGASPVWSCDDSANGKKEDQEASYKPDYTGAFITDWEISGEMNTPEKGNRPGSDFIVDWIN